MRALRTLARGIRAPGAVPALAGGMLLLAALAPPVDARADRLLAVHMVQHLALGVWAPLLFATAAVAARPARPSVSRAARATLGAAVAVHVGVFWFWHVPLAYDAAVRTLALHVVEHLTLLAAGMLFWWAVLRPGRAAVWRRGTGAALGALFAAAVGAGVLAALLTLSAQPFYDVHLATTAGYGLTPLEDQQLAGAVMWVPGGLAYLIAAVVLFGRWLQAGPARRAPALPSPAATGAGGGS